MKQFNQPNTILVVTSYPDPKNGIKELNAVAWHAQKTLRLLASKEQKIIVLAEKTNSKSIYQDSKNILVIRCWQKNNPLSLFKILFWAIRFNQIQSILFQFEFNIFGGIASVLTLPVILALMKILGKKVSFEIHQVVTNISLLAKHINVESKWLQKIFNCGLLSFYKTVGFLADKIIVTEEELGKRMANFTAKNKVVFIPLSIKSQKTISQNSAKKRLGFSSKDFLVMSFGFINWYKGSDWVAKIFTKKELGNTKLILAGGESPTLKEKPYYQHFYQKVEQIARRSKNITLTGFVADEKVRLYFSAADLVILPYRVFMSSSGPLSLAFSFQKPALVSNSLKDYCRSDDFQSCLEKACLKPSEISFAFNGKAFAKRISWAKNQKNLEKLKDFSALMSQRRSENQIGKKYLETVSFEKRLSLSLAPAFEQIKAIE